MHPPCFRISNDLLLWEPTAPSPVETIENMPYGVGLSVASQLINTYSKDSFSQFRSTGPEGKIKLAVSYEILASQLCLWREIMFSWSLFCAEETSGSEEENLHYYSPASELGFRSRKKKKPKAHNRSSQSLFSVILSVNHGLVALQTSAKVKSAQYSL